MNVLAAEIGRHVWSWSPETLYFGGGTPSLLPPEDLRSIINLVPCGSLREVTLECAPGTIGNESPEAWAEMGINRISLGVQSFIAEELRQTGRRHTAEIVAGDVARLRAAGIRNINIDLIAGLPGQTRASWEESLNWIERLQPPHVSIYLFEMDEDSRLGKEALLGGIRYGAGLLPSDEAMAEFYELAVSRLEKLGIARYEISNFAEPGHESLHNMKYWELAPYVGFGLDAHSFDNGRRWSNPDDLNVYLEGPCSQEAAQTDGEEEHFFVGLRLTSGIAPTAHERERFAEPIHRWLDLGLLEQRGERLRLSDRGVLVSNDVLQEFISV